MCFGRCVCGYLVTAAVAIEAGAVETVVVDVAGARRRRWDRNNFKLAAAL